MSIRYMSNFHIMLLCQDSTSGVQTGQQCLSHCIHTKLLEVFFSIHPDLENTDIWDDMNYFISR